ncbi:MAG: trypsin-like peptidase domain-containing protein [Firmicutes bacterium]|nr:trypsin-like peptidase domain-containing protein [Bacillota bacterium]
MEDLNKFSSGTDGFDVNEKIYVDPEVKVSPQKPKKEKEKYVTKKFFAVTLIIAMVFSAVMGAGVFGIAVSLSGGKIINDNNFSLAEVTGSELSIQKIVAKNENSVVAITTESVSTDSWARQYVTNGAGSGVVYSEDGYILTNNHVIDDATSIKITMHNGDTYKASLVASDPQTDVAVLKVNAKDLDPVDLGSSDAVSVGDLAIAIGNPLGTLAGTATEGIISGLEREITLSGKSMTLIQISASVNPGNSGGGVFDHYGNLIGLVVAKSSGSDVEGLGFAIPVDTVKKVADALIEDGYVKGRPAAGITIVDLTSASDAMKYGVKTTGVYIDEVTGSNAKKAGLKAGDLIYMINDKKVTDSDMLVREIQSHEVGEKVTFTIVRNDEMKDYEVVLQDSNEIK